MFNYTKEMIEKTIKEAPVEVIEHGKTPDEYRGSMASPVLLY